MFKQSEVGKMPIVHVNVWEGFGKEKAKIVIQKITKVFVDLGIPQQAVGIGGEPASEKFEETPSK